MMNSTNGNDNNPHCRQLQIPNMTLKV